MTYVQADTIILYVGVQGDNAKVSIQNSKELWGHGYLTVRGGTQTSVTTRRHCRRIFRFVFVRFQL